MKKYSKKLALILALSLVLAVAIPALAAGENETVIDGLYDAPKIKVVLPVSGAAVINPYGLPVDIGEKDGEGNTTTLYGTVTGSQIVTDTPLAGYNYGTVPLKIGATVTGSIPAGSEFKLAADKPDSDSTLKTGLVYFEVKAATGDLDYTVGEDTGAYYKGLKIEKIVDELNGWKSSFSGEGKSGQILVSTRAVTKNGMASIAAGVDGKPTTGSCFVARLGGDIVKSPKGGWAATDGVTVTITWILEPAPVSTP